MSLLIMRRGRVVYCGDDWDELESYAGGKPNEVCVWPFERSRCGKVTVDYSDGALASFTGDSFGNLSEYMLTLHKTQGWPKPRVFHTPLPNVGLMPQAEPEPEPEPEPREQSDDAVEEAVEPEPTPEPVKEVRHRRQRVVEEPKHEPVPEPRKRRSRVENTERIRRVRSG